MTSWVAPSPANKYGGAQVSQQKATSDATALPSMAGPPAGASSSPLSPASPLFWIGVIAAASVGLMAYSTTVRVGPASVSAHLGK